MANSADKDKKISVNSLTLSSEAVIQVAMISAILGGMVGAGLFGWMLVQQPGLPPVFLYMALISLFHLAEFLLYSASSPKPHVCLDSFLLDNGAEYICAILLPVVEFTLEWKLMPTYKSFRIFRIVGLMLAIGGQVLRSWTISHAGISFTHIVSSECSLHHRLIIDGPFAYCRHPSYAGFFAWALGLQIILVNPISIICYATILFNFFKERVDREERALLERFGAEYLTFRRRTWSGIPFLE